VIRKCGDTNAQVLKAALGCLAVLTSDERNLAKLRGELGGVELDQYPTAGTCAQEFGALDVVAGRG
jgi:hypothetical protein